MFLLHEWLNELLHNDSSNDNKDNSKKTCSTSN